MPRKGRKGRRVIHIVAHESFLAARDLWPGDEVWLGTLMIPIGYVDSNGEFVRS